MGAGAGTGAGTGTTFVCLPGTSVSSVRFPYPYEYPEYTNPRIYLVSEHNLSAEQEQEEALRSFLLAHTSPFEVVSVGS